MGPENARLPQVSAAIQEAVELLHRVGGTLIVDEGHEAVRQSLA